MEFKQFDMQEIERTKQQYAAEVTARWGSTDTYAESQRKTSRYGAGEWTEIQSQMQEIFTGFAALVGTSPADPRVQALVARWQAHISANYYNCTKEILAGLGQMYTGDARFTQNIDRCGAGTAQLMSNAITLYCNAD